MAKKLRPKIWQVQVSKVRTTMYSKVSCVLSVDGIDPVLFLNFSSAGKGNKAKLCTTEGYFSRGRGVVECRTCPCH